MSEGRTLDWQFSDGLKCWWVDTSIGRFWINQRGDKWVFEYCQPRSEHETERGAKLAAEDFYRNHPKRKADR